MKKQLFILSIAVIIVGIFVSCSAENGGSQDVSTTAVTDSKGTTHYYAPVTDDEGNVSTTEKEQGVYAEIETTSNGKAVTKKDGTYVTKAHTTVLPIKSTTKKTSSTTKSSTKSSTKSEKKTKATEKATSTTKDAAGDDNNVAFDPDETTDRTKPNTTTTKKASTTTKKSTTTTKKATTTTKTETTTKKEVPPATDKDGWITKWY